MGSYLMPGGALVGSKVVVDKNKLRVVIADAVDIDEHEILPDAHFIADLELDSLASLEVLVRLEKEFGIRIPEQDLKLLTSLNAVESYLSESAD